ncbi:MAG: choice-of-anchor P family protein [Gaiellaceae bacterium]
MFVRLLWPAVALLALALAAPIAAATPESSSTALGARVVVPGGAGATSTAVASPPRASASNAGFTFPEGGAVVSTGSLAVESRARLAPDPGSFARADVGAISLFGGEITAGRVYVQAGARATPTNAGGQLSASTIENLVVLGAPIEIAPNQQIALGDWGYLVALEQAVVTDGAPTPGYRGFVVGLHVHLTADHAGLPAGSEILVGYAEAAVRSSGVTPAEPPTEAEPVDDPVEEPAPSQEPAATEPIEPAPAQAQPTPAPPELATSGPAAAPEPPAVQGPPAAVTPQFTGAGFVFPVYGPAGFSDDYQAARASTGWHHGNDIYAPLGAPVLAATDGELFLVGWNAVGGHRLWLRDDAGNEYYFAHLSAYTPVAQNGARVKAGDVLGFVGASGDAVGTPPHLHFEIHPFELLDRGYDGVINPFPFLSAWQRAIDADVSFAQSLPLDTAAPVATAPLPAAVPLGYIDISYTSGLDSAGLERVLSFPSAIVEESYSLLSLPQRSPITDAEPGFSAR